MLGADDLRTTALQAKSLPATGTLNKLPIKFKSSSNNYPHSVGGSKFPNALWRANIGTAGSGEPVGSAAELRRGILFRIPAIKRYNECCPINLAKFAN